jgi:hypothetical protein
MAVFFIASSHPKKDAHRTAEAQAATKIRIAEALHKRVIPGE